MDRVVLMLSARRTNVNNIEKGSLKSGMSNGEHFVAINHSGSGARQFVHFMAVMHAMAVELEHVSGAGACQWSMSWCQLW